MSLGYQAKNLACTYGMAYYRSMAVAKAIKIFLILIVLFACTVPLLEMAIAPDPECALPGYHATYISWDDFAGPCTYLQRVVFGLFWMVIFPLLFMWPVLVILVMYLALHLIKYRNLHKAAATPIILTLLGTVTLWSILTIILRIIG